MAVRTHYVATIALSSDPTNEEKDLGNRESEVVCDQLNEGGTWKNVLVASATDVAVQLTQIATAKFVLIRTASVDPSQAPGAITVKKNSTSGEAWTIQPLPGTKEGHFMVSTDSITALYLSNPGTVNMTVIVAMAGD